MWVVAEDEKPVKKEDGKPAKEEDEKPVKKEDEKPVKKEDEKPAKEEAVTKLVVTDITNTSFSVTTFPSDAEVRLMEVIQKSDGSGIRTPVVRDDAGEAVIKTLTAAGTYTSSELGAPELKAETTYRVQIKDKTDSNSIHYVDFTTTA